MPEHFLDIRAGFSDSRHFSPFDAIDTGVVSSQRERKVFIVPVEQTTQLFCTSPDILNRVVDIGHVQGLGCGWHQLHQPHCALSRHSILFEAGLHFNDSPEQTRIETKPLRIEMDRATDFPLRRAGAGFKIALSRGWSNGDQ